MRFRCYHCGWGGFRVVRRPDTVECLMCNRSAPFRIPKIRPEDRPKMPSFACPECNGRSFVVLQGDPVMAKCMICLAEVPLKLPR